MSTITRKWHTEWLGYARSRYANISDWIDIAANANFLPEFITMPDMANILTKWTKTHWTELGNNPNLTIDFIIDHPEFIDKWNFVTVSRNKNITPAIINANPCLDWNWTSISQNPSVAKDLDFLEENSFKLDFKYIIQHAPLKFIETYVGTFSYFFKDQFWNWMSCNPNITTDFFLDNIDYPWNWGMLTDNPAISLEFIEEHLVDGLWDWNILAANKMTFKFYEKYGWLLPELQNLEMISLNSNMIEFIASNPGLEWNWKNMSHNDGLTFSLIKSMPDKPWDWHVLSQHRNITMEDIESRPAFQWSWFGMSSNPNVSVPFINRSYFQPWARKYLFKNNMDLGRERYIAKEYDKLTKTAKENYEYQLMEVAWHPNRLAWVLDQEQAKKYI
jgi:hypothetical protein